MKILLIEDDDAFIKVLTKMLKAHHFIIDTVKDGEMGWTYGSTFEYDVMIIDLVLPKLDGISLCKRFRAEGYVTPILLLTSQDSSTARVQGLDAGADDYVAKPFDPIELVARIRALLRRSSTNPFPLLTWGDLILNPSTCEVSYAGQQLTLTTKEYELLELLMRNSQQVFGTDELLDHLWSSEKFPSEATVRSHIRRVRQKLAAIGAPPDFIATIHGRGYYLKAPVSDRTAAQAQRPQKVKAIAHSATTANSLAVDPRSWEAQQQYLAFLNEIWATTKSDSLDGMTILTQAIRDLQSGQLTPQAQSQAQQMAHKLAGTLSIFGLHKAVHLTRQLERWLGGQDPLQPSQAPLIQQLVMALHQEIQDTIQIQLSQVPNGYAPLLLLIGADEEFNQAFRAIADSRGIAVEVGSPRELETRLGTLEIASDGVGQPPSLILLHLPAHSASADELEFAADQTERLLRHLQTCTQRYPALPVVVIGDRLELHDRLKLARCGTKLLLDASTPLDQIVAKAVNLLKGAKPPTKVMVVDDDTNWLQTLPTLLKPWGFKVTTLADPQQFWNVLQAVTPDVLILDVNMPEINGYELCQVLRSDPQWQRLPVLFLSVLTDATSHQQAFTVGADDFLCKPLMGSELANRILSRLRRVQAWAS
jgi:DNA-binding response OmpR family regulator/HPt (histidine-containing phosphotransfer) domain-containing protein